MFSACKKSYWTWLNVHRRDCWALRRVPKRMSRRCGRRWHHRRSCGIIQKWWVAMAPNGGGNFRWDLLNSLMYLMFHICSTKKTWVRENFKSVTQLVDAVRPGARQWRANGPSFERSEWKIAEFHRPFLRCLATTWEGEKVSLRLGVVTSYLWNRQDRHSRKSHQGTTAVISSDIL